MPRAAAAFKSTLSVPVPQIEISLSAGQACITSAVNRVRPRIFTATSAFLSRSMSTAGSVASLSYSRTSSIFRRRSSAGVPASAGGLSSGTTISIRTSTVGGRSRPRPAFIAVRRVAQPRGRRQGRRNSPRRFAPKAPTQPRDGWGNDGRNSLPPGGPLRYAARCHGRQRQAGHRCATGAEQVEQPGQKHGARSRAQVTGDALRGRSAPPGDPV